MTLPAAFATKTVESTCTVWVGASNNKGYGVVYLDGRPQLAHRVAYEAQVGPIPDGYVLDHLCRVRNCVRVDHLEPVTQQQNTQRGRAARTLAVGDECINGHTITDESQLYTRPTGAVECRACRGAESHRDGRRRPTVRKRAAVVKAVHERT